jgi:hypothetical protein
MLVEHRYDVIVGATQRRKNRDCQEDEILCSCAHASSFQHFSMLRLRLRFSARRFAACQHGGFTALSALQLVRW